MKETRDTLIRSAAEARANSYAPYSEFRVGAALLADDGKIYRGTNVENSSYPQGQCAEASAIGAMVTAGGRKIHQIAIVADSPDLCTPCGGCRQKILEFATGNTLVHVGGLDGYRRTFRFSDLLPEAFGRQNLC